MVAITILSYQVNVQRKLFKMMTNWKEITLNAVSTIILNSNLVYEILKHWDIKHWSCIDASDWLRPRRVEND